MKEKTRAPETIEAFVAGKSAHAISLLRYFIAQYARIGKVRAIPAKTMIGIATERKRIAYVTHIGRDFIRVVFPFPVPHEDNLCFEKIAQVPGDVSQYNHHLKLMHEADVNDEVRHFMKMAYDQGK